MAKRKCTLTGNWTPSVWPVAWSLYRVYLPTPRHSWFGRNPAGHMSIRSPRIEFLFRWSTQTGRKTLCLNIITFSHIVSAGRISIGTRLRAKENVLVWPVNNSACMIRCFGEGISGFHPGEGGGRRFERFEPSTEPRRHWEQLYWSTSLPSLVCPPHQITSSLNRKLSSTRRKS
jgi:hypothetical protein